jgi:hypothetical protein
MPCREVLVGDTWEMPACSANLFQPPTSNLHHHSEHLRIYIERERERETERGGHLSAEERVHLGFRQTIVGVRVCHSE